MTATLKERAKVLARPGVRSYGVIVFFSAATSAMSFLTSVVVARDLGPAVFGRFAVFYSIFQMTWTATNFGDQSYVRFASTLPEDEQRAYLRATVVVELSAVLLLAALAYPLAGLLAGSVFHDPHYHRAVAMGLAVGACMNLLTLVGATYQARQRYLRYALVATVFYGTMLASVGAVALFSHLTLGRLFTIYGVVAAAMFFLSLGRLAYLARPLRIEWSVLRPLLSFGRFLIGANVAYVLYQRMDVIFVARYAPPAGVGQYGVALRVAVLASLFTGSLAPFLLPQAARTKGSSERLRAYLRRAAALSGGLLVIIAVLWLNVPLVTRVLFGSAYSASAVLCRILLLATASIAIYTPLSQLFLVEDRPRAMLHLGLVKLGATIALLLLLSRAYGAAGSAWAVAGSEVVTAAFVVTRVRGTLAAAFGGDS
jgi:O-antigen/teichoic acid export membrane protein